MFDDATTQMRPSGCRKISEPQTAQTVLPSLPPQPRRLPPIPQAPQVCVLAQSQPLGVGHDRNENGDNEGYERADRRIDQDHVPGSVGHGTTQQRARRKGSEDIIVAIVLTRPSNSLGTISWRNVDAQILKYYPCRTRGPRRYGDPDRGEEPGHSSRSPTSSRGAPTDQPTTLAQETGQQ